MKFFPGSRVRVRVGYARLDKNMERAIVSCTLFVFLVSVVGVWGDDPRLELASVVSRTVQIYSTHSKA